jgi:hypothetical protein
VLVSDAHAQRTIGNGVIIIIPPHISSIRHDVITEFVELVSATLYQISVISVHPFSSY